MSKTRMYRIAHDPGALSELSDELADERRTRPACVGNRLELVAKQQDRLVAMLRFALAHSPHYRKIVAEIGLSPDHGLAIFRQLPLLTRSRYAEALENMKVGVKHQCYRDRTSGTSGVPVEVFRDSRSVLFESLRLRDTIEYYLADAVALAPERIAIVYVSHYLASQEHIYKDPMLDGAYIVKVRCDLGSVSDRMKTHGIALSDGPYTLTGTVSSLLYLARSHRARAGLPRPAIILSSGEVLSQEARKLLQDTLKAPVFELYTLREFGTVGFQCKHGKGFHLEADWFVFEVIGSKWLPVSNGLVGELVITDLSNRHVPLLRYMTGDSGSVHWTKCSCGLALPLLLGLSGRTPVNFIASDGSTIDTAVFMKRLQKLPLLWYRVTQAVDRSVTIECVLRGRDPAPRLARLCSMMKRILGTNVPVHARNVGLELVARHGKKGGFYSLNEPKAKGSLEDN